MSGLEGSGKEPGASSVFARKFRIMLEVIPHPQSGKWSGTKLERATGGKVKTSYFSSLRDGHIHIPRVDKIEAIAEAMGFSPELWFRDLSWWQALHERLNEGEDVETSLRGYQKRSNGKRFSELLERLFKVKINEETGRPFTNRDVAAKSRGVLTEEDVVALREGRTANPTWAQVLVLCDVFGVDPSYWTERKNPWAMSETVLEAMEEQDSYMIFQNSLQLSEENRTMLRLLSEHLRRGQLTESDTGEPARGEDDE